MMLSSILKDTHPIHFLSTGMAMLANTGGLLWLNHHHRLKKRNQTATKDTTSLQQQRHESSLSLPWEQKRLLYWITILLLCTIVCTLQAFYPIDTRIVIYIEAYAFIFPVGLLDLYFAERIQGINPKVMVGASVYCIVNIIRQFTTDCWYGSHFPLEIVKPPLSLVSLLHEMGRFVVNLAGVGIFSDLFFSPVHRFMHSHPYFFQHYHKTHHLYNNTQLTSLVLYLSHDFDNFLMAMASTGVGAWLLWIVSLTLFPNYCPTSNLTFLLLVVSTQLSHAHDVRCARLIAPGIPDGLNFVAYHYVHHCNPACNFGLSMVSDMIWDWILGVSTIQHLSQINNKGER